MPLPRIGLLPRGTCANGKGKGEMPERLKAHACKARPQFREKPPGRRLCPGARSDWRTLRTRHRSRREGKTRARFFSTFRRQPVSVWFIQMRWNKISIIGAGLLGGSLALAIKQRQLAARVHAFVRREASVAEGRKLEIADLVTTDIQEAVEGAEMVVLCTPLSQMAGRAADLRPFLKPGAVVTDVGSVKGTVVRELEPIIRQGRGEFVGSHPMAGSEKTGAAAARADLFQNAVCLVTPGARTSAEAVATVESFWQAVGAWPVRMSAEAHDDLVSRSSHLPHVVAAELANYVLSPAHPKEQALVCATGFRDTTRIASGSPEMWRDIALTNRRNLSRALGAFIGDLRKLQRALKNADAKVISKFFERAKQRRDAWCARCAWPSPE